MFSSSDFEDVAPLYLDEESKRELESRSLSCDATPGRWNLLAIPQQMFKEIRNRYTIPRARACIEKQLEDRTTFFEKDWRKTELPFDLVIIVLDCIRSSFDWPNRNFLPEDPIDLLWIPVGSDMAGVEPTVELEDRLSIRLTEEHIQRLNKPGRTVEGFIRELIGIL